MVSDSFIFFTIAVFIQFANLFEMVTIIARPGSHTSLDQSIDDVSSACGLGGRGAGVDGGSAATAAAAFGSRVSLANTSLTSAPDLSTLSSLTLARRVDTDQASILSEKMSVDGADSGRSPDSKSVKSPLVTRNGIGGSGDGNVTPLSPRNLKSSRGSKNIRSGDPNSMYSSPTAISHPHLASSEKSGKPESETEAILDNRRSVQSDNGYYNQADTIPYTNFSEFTNGVNDSDEEDGLPPHTPLTGARPNNLSVSQTTLIRDPDTAPTSEPATPRAGDTPDTVRIYVPYAGDADIYSHDDTLLKYGKTWSKPAISPAPEMVISVQTNATDDAKEIMLIDPPSINDVLNSHEYTNVNTEVLKEKDSTKYSKYSTALNGIELNLALAEADADTHRIKIKVDGDETLSSLSSPRDAGSCPTSPVGAVTSASSPKKQFPFTESRTDSVYEHQSRGPFESEFKQVSPKSEVATIYDDYSSVNRNSSHQRTESFLSDMNKSYSSGRSSEAAYVSGSPGSTEQDNRSNPSPFRTTSESTISATSTVTPDALASSPTKRKERSTQSPVHVTISSYYETKHQRTRLPPASGDKSVFNYEPDSSRGIQHYYHHRQSSSSPPVTTSPPLISRVAPTKKPPPSSQQSHRKGVHQRHSSEHSTYGFPESVSHSRMLPQLRDKHLPLSSSTSSINTSHKVVTSYNNSQAFHSKIIDESFKSSSHKQSSSSENKYKFVDTRANDSNTLYSSSSHQFESRSQREGQRYVSQATQDFKHFIADEPVKESFPPPHKKSESQQYDRYSTTAGNVRLSKNNRNDDGQRIPTLGQPFQAPSSAFRNSQR